MEVTSDGGDVSSEGEEMSPLRRGQEEQMWRSVLVFVRARSGR